MNMGMLEQIRNDMENGTYNMTDNGRCTGCGSCCSKILPMTEKEIRNIKKYMIINRIKECRHDIPLADPRYELACPFLDTTRRKDKCIIYSVRPDICRRFSCDPEKRYALDAGHIRNAKIINVRSVFFGKD